MSLDLPINLDRVFRISSVKDSQALHLKIVKDATWEPFRRETDLMTRLVKGEMPMSAPLRFVPSAIGGSIPRDQITTELVNIRLFSDRIFESWKSWGITGWSTFSVAIHDKNGANVPGYHGLAVTGRCGPIVDSRSQRALPPPWIIGPRDREVMMGMYFDPGTWDGSDVFTPNGGHVFVTEKVKRVLNDIGATNILFTRLSDLENQLATLRMRRSALGRDDLSKGSGAQ